MPTLTHPFLYGWPCFCFFFPVEPLTGSRYPSNGGGLSVPLQGRDAIPEESQRQGSSRLISCEKKNVKREVKDPLALILQREREKFQGYW